MIHSDISRHIDTIFCPQKMLKWRMQVLKAMFSLCNLEEQTTSNNGFAINFDDKTKP